MFGYDVEVLSQQALAQKYMDDKNAYGAIRYKDGFGINPLKLAWGYQTLAQKAGASIYSGSPVIHWLEPPKKSHNSKPHILQRLKVRLRLKK